MKTAENDVGNHACFECPQNTRCDTSFGVTNVTASNIKAENRLTNSKTVSNRCDTGVDGVTTPNPVALTEIAVFSVTPTAALI